MLNLLRLLRFEFKSARNPILSPRNFSIRQNFQFDFITRFAPIENYNDTIRYYTLLRSKIEKKKGSNDRIVNPEELKITIHDDRNQLNPPTLQRNIENSLRLDPLSSNSSSSSSSSSSNLPLSVAARFIITFTGIPMAFA